MAARAATSTINGGNPRAVFAEDVSSVAALAVVRSVLRRNIHWFETLVEAQHLIEAWRIDYNQSRPHMALGNKTPAEYLLQAIPSPSAQGKKAAEN